MQEIWKEIPNSNGLYFVSSLGKVKSVNPSRLHGNKEHFLKPYVINSGYEVIEIYTGVGKRKKHLVHKLVAEAFIPNPDNLPCINHKDENKLNNSLENLEWCSYKYNNNYGTARIRQIEKMGRRVSQYDLNEHWIASFLSVKVASKYTNTSATYISDCCKGKCTSAKGYIWKYD